MSDSVGMAVAPGVEIVLPTFTNVSTGPGVPPGTPATVQGCTVDVPATAKPLWRVSLNCPTPLLHRTFDVEADNEQAAKAAFNEANGIKDSVHPYTVRQIAPGTPAEASSIDAPTSLQAYALQVADELEKAAREFASDRRAKRIIMSDDLAKQITAKLRELAKK